jgi:class 3 adenylate cyclase
MHADEEGTLERFRLHHSELIEPKINEHKGRIVKLLGDGLLVEFASVLDAVRCATEIQRGMAARNADVPEDERIILRIGINLGDVIVEGDDIHGDGVNVATRMQEIAQPGGISVSGVVYDSVRDKLAPAFENLGP